MPKQMITVIGLLISLGVIALGIALVALPMYLESLSVDAQTATVKQSNDLYQAQVDQLRQEAERQDEIDASVAALTAQIPEFAQLDEVFEVISRASESTGARITSITAGEALPFVARTGATAIGDAEEQASAPGDETDGTAEDGAGAEGVDPGVAVPDPNAPLSGRQQVDFTISVTANDMAQVTAFLDALRAGPRLLSSITATATQTGTTIEVQVGALTFVNAEG